jgi:D-serine deaminase-like pyridoxal phosphate-dependent protein
LEAEAFFQAGFRDIFIACPQASRGAIEKIAGLVEKGAELIVGFDHHEQIVLLEQAAEAISRRISVRLEIDSGHHRCGISSVEEIVKIAREVRGSGGLELEGIYTHAGHVYGSTGLEQTRRIAKEEGEALVRASRVLAEAGVRVRSLSAGSTPTHRWVAEVEGVTELRPGNYVFFDAMQVGLGVVGLERCALRVMGTVLSVYEGRFVIDAGSKALGLDKGAHGMEGLRGHGIMVGGHNWEISRLSEEQGIVEVLPGEGYPKVGESIEIVPNHACVVANLGGGMWMRRGERMERVSLVGRR